MRRNLQYFSLIFFVLPDVFAWRAIPQRLDYSPENASIPCCWCSHPGNSSNTWQMVRSTGKTVFQMQKGTNRRVWQGSLKWKLAAEDKLGEKANLPMNWELGTSTRAGWLRNEPEWARSLCPAAERTFEERQIPWGLLQPTGDPSHLTAVIGKVRPPQNCNGEKENMKLSK